MSRGRKQKAESQGEAPQVPPSRRKVILLAGAALGLLFVLALVRLWWVGGYAYVQHLRTGMPVLLPSEHAERQFLSEIGKATPLEQDGEFLLGPEFLDIFNSFTAQYQGKDRGLLLRAFGEWAQENYSAEVAQFLYGVFQKYLDYIDALQQPEVFPPGASADQKFQIMLALRNKIMGEKISRLLFRNLDESLHYALLLRGIAEDPDLTEEQKKQKVEELKASLDPETRERVFPTDEQREYLKKLDQIEKETAGLPEDQKAVKIRDMRLQMFGPEAAGRLEDLDRVRLERAEREKVYDEEKAKIDADSSLSAEQRQQKIKELREDVLRPEQVRRLEAIEAMAKWTPEEIARQLKAQQEGKAPAPDMADPAQQGANLGVDEKK